MCPQTRSWKVNGGEVMFSGSDVCVRPHEDLLRRGRGVSHGFNRIVQNPDHLGEFFL